MLIPTSPILSNGKTFTRNSAAIRLNGITRIIAVDSIDWEDDRPNELVQGMNNGGIPLGKADGIYTCSATIGIYGPWAPQFESAVLLGDPIAAATQPGNLNAATFQLMILMTEGANTIDAELVNCNIVGRPTRTIGNDGATFVKQYKLQPLYIIEDGKSLVNLTPAI